MKMKLLGAIIASFFVINPALAISADEFRDMGAPEYASLPAETLRVMHAEGVTEEIYNKIRKRQVVTVRKPTPKGKSGAHFMTYIMVAGSVENAWHAVDDCKEMTTYVPHFAECDNTVPSNPPPPERHDGLSLKYLRLSKNVVKFSFVTVTMFQDVWVNKPNVYLWRQNHGDMKFNEGYWRFIPVKPKLIVMAYQTLTDVGRLVPDFIQKTLTEKDLPNNVRVTRKHIEEVLEKR